MTPGMPPPPGGSQSEPEQKYGWLGRLLGQKHQANLRKEERFGKDVTEMLHGVSTGAIDPSPEFVQLLIQQTSKLYGKEAGAQFKQHFEQHEAAKDLERRKQLLPQQPGGSAPPAMATPAAAPPNASRGATAGGGIPLPPFEQGAAAGPAPQQQPNPVAEMKTGSQLGTQGFGGPVAAPAPSDGNFFRRGPVQRGVDAAAFARPGAEQAQGMALGNRAAEHGQDVQWDKDKATRLTQALQSIPGFNEIPNFQKQEMLMRAMGIQGAIAAPVKAMNLPASAIHGSEFPEDSLTIDGKPLDREKGWYRQTLDPNTNQIRGYPVQPRLTNTAVTTANGKFLVSRDPRGEIVKVIDSIRGNQIVDPAMLETVRHTLMQRETVDEKGNTISVLDPVTSTSGKVVPGQRAAPGLPSPPGQPGAQPTPTQAPPRGASGLLPRPKPLTAATRGAAEFAQTIAPEIPRIKNMVNALNAAGKLGIVASRWSDFLASKVGTEPEYVPLRNAVGLLNTALGRVHGGAKGGGSTTMLEHFGEMQNTGKMDAATLIAALNETGIWIDHYAGMGANRPGAVNMGPPPPAMTPPPTGAPKKDSMGIR